jgi:hypothetical protein
MKATHNPPAEVRTTPADLLRCAALYLYRHGWTQCDYYAPVFDAVTPPACASGALAMAAYGSPLDVPYIADRSEQVDYRAALRALIDYLDLGGANEVFLWNDAPGSTADEVINALNAAADRWDILHTQGGENA